MKAITKLLAGGVAIAALASAAPAAAQYYPGYGNPYGSGAGGIIGSIINGMTGYGNGYGGYGYSGYGYNGYNGGYGANSQVVVSQCTNAVQARLSGGNGYGYGYAGGGRVLGVSRVEPRSNGLMVRGVASTGRYAGYGSAYGQVQLQPDLVWTCRADYRGYIVDVDVDPAQSNYGYNAAPYGTPYVNDYSQYGYQRY